MNVFVTRRLAARRAAARSSAEGAAYGRGAAERPARPGGVRQREPHRAAAHRARAERRARRRARAAARRRRVGRSSASTTSTTPGGQMDRFGASVEARYLQLLGREAEVPEDGYHGDYIAELAARHPARAGRRRSPTCPPDERLVRARARRARAGSLGWIRANARAVRRHASMSIFSRGRARERRARSTRRSNASASAGTPTRPTARCGSARRRSATTRIGSSIRSNGAHTYFAADCAYLVDKFSRGFDHLIYVWGADHHGDVARVKGAARGARVRPRGAWRSCSTSGCRSCAAASRCR